jgi:hypothetical protein
MEDHLPRSRFQQPGERVVQGQRLMQAASDIYLGWTKGVQAERYFYCRQLRDMKGSSDVEDMSPVALSLYATHCGWTLARAHARSGDPMLGVVLFATSLFSLASVRGSGVRSSGESSSSSDAWCSSRRRHGSPPSRSACRSDALGRNHNGLTTNGPGSPW